MGLVKLQITEGAIYVNPDQVQLVANAFDEKKNPIIGGVLVYTITEKILVKGSLEEVAASLGITRIVTGN